MDSMGMVRAASMQMIVEVSLDGIMFTNGMVLCMMWVGLMNASTSSAQLNGMPYVSLLSAFCASALICYMVRMVRNQHKHHNNKINKCELVSNPSKSCKMSVIMSM